MWPVHGQSLTCPGPSPDSLWQFVTAHNQDHFRIVCAILEKCSDCLTIVLGYGVHPQNLEDFCFDLRVLEKDSELSWRGCRLVSKSHDNPQTIFEFHEIYTVSPWTGPSILASVEWDDMIWGTLSTRFVLTFINYLSNWLCCRVWHIRTVNQIYLANNFGSTECTEWQNMAKIWLLSRWDWSLLDNYSNSTCT